MSTKSRSRISSTVYIVSNILLENVDLFYIIKLKVYCKLSCNMEFGGLAFALRFNCGVDYNGFGPISPKKWNSSEDLSQNVEGYVQFIKKILDFDIGNSKSRLNLL